MKKNRVPTFCLSLLEETWDGETAEVIGIKVGDSGYYKTTYGRATHEWVRMFNDHLGVNEILQETFECCSIFGNWSNAENVAKHIAEAKLKMAQKAQASAVAVS